MTKSQGAARKPKDDDLKDIIRSYFRGQKIKITRVRLQTECDDYKKNASTLYKRVLIKSANDPFLIDILADLNIHPDSASFNRLINKSNHFYELLVHLYHDGYQRAGLMLRLIHQAKTRRPWSLIFSLGFLASVTIGLSFHFNQESFRNFWHWLNTHCPKAINWLKSTCLLVRNIPLIALIYNSLMLLHSWYTTFANGTTTTTYKMTKLAFKTLTLGLVITAYYLTFNNNGLLLLPAAALFVASAGIDVIKSIYMASKSLYALYKQEPPEEDAAWGEKAQYISMQNLHKRQVYSIWIKLTAALLMTLAVAVWAFYPPTLAMTICSVVAMLFITKAKQSILATIRTRFHHQLQEALDTSYKEAHPRVSKNASTQTIITELCKENGRFPLEDTATASSQVSTPTPPSPPNPFFVSPCPPPTRESLMLRR